MEMSDIPVGRREAAMSKLGLYDVQRRVLPGNLECKRMPQPVGVYALLNARSLREAWHQGTNIRGLNWLALESAKHGLPAADTKLRTSFKPKLHDSPCEGV
jgi:hypothetical protein